jgi:ATP-dependent DNA ligase
VFSVAWVSIASLLDRAVTKRLEQPYRPGKRGWVKIKDKHYWRYPLEVAAVRRGRGTASSYRL